MAGGTWVKRMTLSFRAVKRAVVMVEGNSLRAHKGTPVKLAHAYI